MKQLLNSPVNQLEERLLVHLENVYPMYDIRALAQQLINTFNLHKVCKDPLRHHNNWDETDILTITYGDTIRDPAERDDQPVDRRAGDPGEGERELLRGVLGGAGPPARAHPPGLLGAARRATASAAASTSSTSATPVDRGEIVGEDLRRGDAARVEGDELGREAPGVAAHERRVGPGRRDHHVVEEGVR